MPRLWGEANLRDLASAIIPVFCFVSFLLFLRVLSVLCGESLCSGRHRIVKHAKVYLVGAGPGDPELLTLKAVRVIGEADVVLIDDLVSREVLRHARPQARVIEVGKRGGCRSTPQAFIEKFMVRLARAGRIVARVKGGDPFVFFGRGGEEILALQRAGIEVEVVSGLSAGIAVPAALGIPVTHRGLSEGVTFVTGHTGDGREPNWRVLAASRTTLVIYMGVARAAAIVSGLLEGGFEGTTPAAVIQSGTLPTQRSVVTTLADLPSAISRHDIGSPAVIVVGDVVRLARKEQAALAQVA
jgi:uroporphyrin-III C-methyltransferase